MNGKTYLQQHSLTGVSYQNAWYAKIEQEPRYPPAILLHAV
jgi:hypothetical protein